MSTATLVPAKRHPAHAADGGEDPGSSPPSSTKDRPAPPSSRTLHRDFAVAMLPDGVDAATDYTDPTIPPGGARLPSQRYCGQGALIGCSPDRSHVILIPLRCKSWDCPTCGPRKRRDYIALLKSGEPDRELTLTAPAEPGTDPREIARRMKKAFTKLVARIRKTFGLFEYALVWELTKKGTPHAHILFRGTYISKRWISSQWVALGFGPVVFIQSVKSHGLHAAHACKYLAKATGQTAMELAPLRLVQKSSGYILKKDPPKTTDRFPGYRWAMEPSSFAFNVEFFQKSIRYQDTVFCADGSVEIFLDKSPVPDWADPSDISWWTSPDHALLPTDYSEAAPSGPLPFSQPRRRQSPAE